MKPQPDRRSGHDRRQTITGTRGWLNEDVRMSRGFLLTVIVVACAFFGFGTWAAVSTVRDLRSDDCTSAEAWRTAVGSITHDLVDNDRFLIGLADNLSPNGLPDEFTIPLEQRYTAQDSAIDDALRGEACPSG